MPSHRVTLSILLAVLLWGAAHAELRLVDSRLIRDRDFAANGNSLNHEILGFVPDGAHLTVVVANEGPKPVTIESVWIGGRPFDELADRSVLRGSVPSVNWWYAAPATVAPGERTTLKVRLLELADLGLADFGEGGDEVVRIGIAHTPAGGAGAGGGATSVVEEIDVPLTVGPLWLPYLAFHDVDGDGLLDEASLFVANRGHEERTVSSLRFDERAAVVDWGASGGVIAPAGVSVARVLLPAPLEPGQRVLVQARSRDGARAMGSVRAFPAVWGTSFWQLGFAPERTDPAISAMAVDTAVPGSTVFQDEPFGGRVAPQELAERVTTSWLVEPERPVMVQLSGFDENLVYGDLADITMTHRGTVEAELSHFLSWPKPIWYLPQVAWARVETVGGEERWPPLEALYHEALTGLSRGAKHLQWFTFFNLWSQGHGRGGAFDATRSAPDLFFYGALGNPLVAARIARIDRLLAIFGEDLVTSAPRARTVTPGGIEVTTLQTTSSRVLAVLRDLRTPAGFFEDGLPGTGAVTLLDQTLAFAVPPEASFDRAFLVDLLTGVRELPLQRPAPDRVVVELPEFRGGGLLLLATVADGASLSRRYRERMGGLSAADGALASLLASAHPLPGTPWSFAEAAYRLSVDVEVPVDYAAGAPLSLRVPWPRRGEIGGGEVDPATVRVVQRSPEPGTRAAREVPFAVAGPAPYVRFPTSTPLPAGDSGERAAVELHGGSGFEALFGNRVVDGVLVTSFASDRHQSYSFFQSFRPLPEWPQGWVPADFTVLSVDARDVERTSFPRHLMVEFAFDADGDGVRDDGSAVPLALQPAVALADGWTRYFIDVEAAFLEAFPGAASFTGRWRAGLLTEVFASSEPRFSQYELRQLDLRRNVRLDVRPAGPLEGGSRLAFDVYFGSADGSPLRPSAWRLAALLGDGPLLGEARPLEVAGVTMTSAGPALSLETDARVRALSVAIFDAAGELIASFSPRSTNRRYQLRAPRRLSAEDTVAVTIAVGKGEAVTLAFDGEGAPIDLGADEARAQGPALPAGWRQPTGPVDGRVLLPDVAARNTSLAVASAARDAVIVAVGERLDFRSADPATPLALHGGRVRLLDSNGRELWRLPRSGRELGPVFAVRLSADGSRLFVAANEAPVTNQDYRETYLVAYDLTPLPTGAPLVLWRHLVGSGAPAPGRAVHQLEVFPDGDVAYIDWHGNVVKVAGDSGKVRWRAAAGTYGRALLPLADGGLLWATLLRATRLGAEGDVEVSVARAAGSELQTAAAGRDGALLALADRSLRVVDGRNGRLLSDTPLPSYVRALRVVDTLLGPLVVAGAIDGSVTATRFDGTGVFTERLPAAMVAAIEPLPSGVAVAWEEFRYAARSQWRFRTVVRVLDWDGHIRFDYAGPWREQPSPARLAATSGGNAVVVATDAAVTWLPLTPAAQGENDGR